jgi:imidazolonepropionase-like amidohydrolase
MSLLSLIVLLHTQSGPPPVAIEHVTVIDCTGAKPQPDRTVIIVSGKITEVAPNAKAHMPAGAQVVDGRGKFLIPGLWDMHVHGTAIPGFLGIYLANGVTGIRDMFDPSGATFKLRKNVQDGKVVGPHIIAAGKIVDGPKPIWPGSITASNSEEGTKAVDSALEQGSDFIKVYSLLPRDAYFAIAKTAKQRHVPFAGHVPESVGVAEASDARQKSMEHLYGILRACTKAQQGPNRVNLFNLEPKQVSPTLRSWLEGYDPAIAANLFATLRRNRTYQCPTLTVLYSMSHPRASRDNIRWRFDYLPSWMRGIWNNPNPRFKNYSPEDWTLQERLFDKNLELVRDMFRAGVPILAGTDVMNPYCMPGFSLHDELAWFVKAGIPPMDALRSATYWPSVYLGRDKQFGTVERGKDADLVLLDGNPLKDIHNTTRIRCVVLGGKLLDLDALKKLMPNTARAASAMPKLLPVGYWLGDE